MITRALGKLIFGKRTLIYLWLSMIFIVSGCGTPASYTQSNPYFNISGASKGGALSIQRVELSFDRGARSITVKKGQAIQPEARIKFQGTGVLAANWLVDDLIVEQVNISLSHGSLLTLSPKSTTRIPDYVPGRHVLSLHINRPAPGFKQPSLSYFVVNN